MCQGSYLFAPLKARCPISCGCQNINNDKPLGCPRSCTANVSAQCSDAWEHCTSLGDLLNIHNCRDMMNAEPGICGNSNLIKKCCAASCSFCIHPNASSDAGF